MNLKIKPVGIDKVCYRITEAVSENKELAEVYTIDWSPLFESKKSAIEHIESCIGRKVDEYEYKNLIYNVGFTKLTKTIREGE